MSLTKKDSNTNDFIENKEDLTEELDDGLENEIFKDMPQNHSQAEELTNNAQVTNSEKDISDAITRDLQDQ